MDSPEQSFPRFCQKAPRSPIRFPDSLNYDYVSQKLPRTMLFRLQRLVVNPNLSTLLLSPYASCILTLRPNEALCLGFLSIPQN